jgi:hypothetical protein
MKLIAKILGGLVFLVLILLVLVPVIFKDNLVQLVKDEANKNLNATVNFGDFDLSIFSNFPNLTFTINDVEVAGIEDFEGVKLAKIGTLSTTLDVMNVVTGSQISINSISVENADFYIKVLETGKANYDEAKPSEETEEATPEEEGGGDFKMALKEYSLKNVNFVYDDALYAFFMEMRSFNHTGKGDFTLDVFLLETKSTIEQFTMKYENLAYLKNTKVDLDMNLEMDLTNFKFTFKENELMLNQLALNFDGWLAMPADDIDMDLTFGAPNNTFKSILSLVPAVYSKDFEGIETSGNFTLAGMVKGTYNEVKMPAFNMDLKVNNARFNYPDLPKSAENINIDLLIDNKDGVDDNTVIDLRKFHVELGDNPIDFSMYLIKPVSDPDFKAKIQSQVNFESLAEVIPLDEGMRFSGTITADANFAGKMSALENEQYDQFNATGKMILTGFEYVDPTLDYPINIKSAYLDFSPQKIDLSNFEMLLGRSDIKLNGTVSNFLPYYLHEQTLYGTLDLASTLIDSDELMGAETTETETEANTETPAEEDMEIIQIPENLDLAFTARIGQFLYDGMEMKSLNGLITVKEGVAKLNNFKMNMLDGSIAISGSYNPVNLEEPTADFSMDIQGFDVEKTFKTFNTVQKIAPIGESASGNFSTTMNFKTLLLSNMEPDLNSISGGGLFKTNNMIIDGSGMLKKAADVFKNDKYTKMELKDTKIKFAFENGEIVTQPFDVNLGGQKATISGKSKFEGDIDYVIATKVPKTTFGATATNTLNGLLGQVKNKTGVDLSTSDNIDLELVVGGTVTDPTVKPRISGIMGDEGAKGKIDEVKTQVKEKVKEKVEETKEDVNKKIAEERAKLVKTATEQGDKLVAEAKVQKANLVKEAEKGAAQLNAEAKARADELKKEAGSNPVKKKAAELAGGKLLKEADKKGQDLIDKAGVKGDELVEKANIKRQELITEAENREIKI